MGECWALGANQLAGLLGHDGVIGDLDLLRAELLERAVERATGDHSAQVDGTLTGEFRLAELLEHGQPGGLGAVDAGPLVGVSVDEELDD